MSTPPAGWYPDPEVPGQQRWWDGTRWTEHRDWTSYLPDRRVHQSGQTAPTHGVAVAALVCGILSLTGCTVFTGIPAIVLGHRARREIRTSAGRLGGEGLATAGLVTGWIGTLVFGIPALILVTAGLGTAFG